MHTATMRWLLTLTLALILAAPSLSLGEVTQRTGVATQGQLAPPIQVIRRVKVSGAYPVEEGVRRESPQQKATNNQTKANAKPAVKNSPIKPSATPIRAIPIRPIPISTTEILTTSVPTNTIGSKPIRSIPIRLKIRRA